MGDHANVHGVSYIYVKGDDVAHGEFASASQKRLDKRAETTRMARNPLPVSTQRRQMIGGGGQHPDSIPKPAAVYAARGSASGREHRPIPGLASSSEWDTFASKLAPTSHDEIHRLTIDPAHSDVPNRILILRCAALFDNFIDFVAKQDSSYQIRLCCDGTHDRGAQKYKLISVGWHATHFTRGSAARKGNLGKNEVSQKAGSFLEAIGWHVRVFFSKTPPGRGCLPRNFADSPWFPRRAAERRLARDVRTARFLTIARGRLASTGPHQKTILGDRGRGETREKMKRIM